MRNRGFNTLLRLLRQVHGLRPVPTLSPSFLARIMAEINAEALCQANPFERMLPRFALASALTAATMLTLAAQTLTNVSETIFSIYMNQLSGGFTLLLTRM